MRRFLMVSVGFMLGIGLSPAQADALLDEAKSLLDAKSGKAAYELLLPHVEQRAGDPDYDYLLALAAIDAGRPAWAIFALERVLANRPDHPQARAELARAYFMMGENTAAKREFEAVLNQQPPQEVRLAISRYLNALEQRFDAQRGKWSGYIELGAGYDSNVNSATSDSLVAVPALGNINVLLDPSGIEQADNFGLVRGGISYTLPVRNDLQVFAGGNVDARYNASKTRYNTSNLDLFGGMRLLRGKDRYSAALQGQAFQLDGSSYRDMLGLNLQWEHIIDARNQASLFAQYTTLRYATQKTRDVDQISLGGAWVHALNTAGAPVVFAGAYAGTDGEQTSSRPDMGRDFWGIRLGGSYNATQQLSLNLALHYQDARYGANDPLFLKRRQDHIYDITLAGTYRISELWSVRPEVRHTISSSNIPITDYRRSQALINVRRDFK